MRFSDRQASLHALHARHGGAGLRNTEGAIPSGRGNPGQELRPGSDLGDLLRGRLDPAKLRAADHPRRRHLAALAREYRPSGRRNHGLTRPRFDPGLDGRADPLRPAAGLSAPAIDAQRRPDTAELFEGRDRQRRVLGQPSEVHDLLAEGVVRGRGNRDQRFRLRLDRKDHRRSLAHHHRRGDGRRQREGVCRLRSESGGREPQRPAATQGAAAAGLAGGDRPLRDGDRRFLVRGAGASQPGRHQDRGLHDPDGGPGGEGRQLHQHAAAAAVPRQGSRPAGRRPLRPLARLPPWAPLERALPRFDRSARPGPAEPHLGLPPGEPRPGIPGPGRALCREGADGN